ncbi:MAG: HAMP domain-containing histidine kinase [Patescibacteria group bacterium]|nr:HAMP domain-containing histidine kinase [Patescibacteria group bacterium]
MDQFWKQFVGSDIGSKHNVFFKARLKLTAFYVIIVAIIVIGFSFFLYQTIGRNLINANDGDFNDVESHHHFVSNTLVVLENDLIFADIVILLGAAGLSFILAGETLRPIQASVEAQKAFAANASHELRTPLAVMRNDIEVFLRNPTPSKDLNKKVMNSNLEEIKHMSGIVEDLLLLARSDNQIIQEHKDVDLDVIIKNMVARIKPLANSKNIQISYISPGTIAMRGASDLLSRMILNILQNSIDHTSSEGAININTENRNSQILIHISDTGVGIPAKDLPHIFTRFYKGDSVKGIGLGLSIVKEIVDQHKGNVSIESTEGKGTTVHISLPLA